VVLLLAAGAALAGLRWERRGEGPLRVVVSDLVGRAASPPAGGEDEAPGVRLEWVRGLDEDPGRALAVATRAAAALVAAHPGRSAVELEVRLPPRVRDLTSWWVWRDAWPGAVRVRPAVGARWPERSTAVEGAARVEWPANGVPTGWRPLERPDRVGAVAGFGVVLVGPWERRGVHGAGEAGDVPIAWWSDGAVAAVERPLANGRCARLVAIPHPAGSDLLATPAAVALRRALGRDCGGRLVTQALADSLAAGSAGAPRQQPAPASAFVVPSATPPRPWPPALGTILWLLVLGALVAEVLLRRASRAERP
jgi:hypothetical protein